MINDPELIKQIIDNIKKLSKEDLDKIMKEADDWYNREVTDTDVDDIENLKTLLFQDNLTQYGKRKLIEYYEEKIKKLEAKLEFKQFGDLDNIQFEDYMNEYIPKQKIKDKIEELKYRADGIAGTYQYADSQEHLQEKKNKVIELRTKAMALEELLKEVNK